MRKLSTILTVLTAILFSGIALAQPANNDCSNATQITDLDGGCTVVNNTGATYDSYVGGCFQHGTNNIWFSFTAQGYFADITVSGVNRPEFFVSYAPTGDPCNIADAVGILCATGGGNYNIITGEIGPLEIGETYYVQVVNNTGGGGGSGNVSICIDNPVAEPGDVCMDAQPFCSDSPETFPANTNTLSPTGPAYGCLLAQPNPRWFYLEIGQSGDINITITPSPSEDIDYIVWGPFTDVAEGCNGGINSAGNIVDCSFSAQHEEYVDIIGAQAGETYIMLITNFSGNETEITASQTGGSGSTDCAILLPIELLNFKATSIKQNNLIEWTTLSERNNESFSLEYSADGFNWREIHTQHGSGNSNSLKYYSFTHKNVTPGINYYRLTQIDFDGKSELFETISVDNKFTIELIKTVNMYGQEVNDQYKGMVIEYYSDGSVIKVIR